MTTHRQDVGARAPGRQRETGSVGDQPGRWIGGVVGGLLSSFVAVVAVAIRGTPAELDLWRIELEGFVGIGLAGIPIGFVLGRALMPFARSAGWRRALVAGAAVGLLAPPLGAIELVGLAMIDGGIGGFGGDTVTAMLVTLVYILPAGLVVSYVAAIATLPVGLAWAVVVRLLPERLLRRLRMPHPVTRLGARHAIVGAAVLAIVIRILTLV
jgi:hypothetical protein